MAKRGGCSLSLLFQNVRSTRGGGLELLEGEMRRWGVAWDAVGLAETWLDAESEKKVGVVWLRGGLYVTEGERWWRGGGLC